MNEKVSTDAKNYLTELELHERSLMVNAYLDLAESRAQRCIPMTMKDWVKRLDSFLEADDRVILSEAGHISVEKRKTTPQMSSRSTQSCRTSSLSPISVDS